MKFTHAGIDISKWQGAWVDPELTLSTGIDFVYLRGTNGSRVDSRLQEFSAICRERNIPFGIYCFFRPGIDARAQARKLAELHKSVGATLMPQLDIEHSDGLAPDKVTHAAKIFIQEIELLFGRPALIYSAAWWWDVNIIPNQIDMTERVKWVARYVSMDKTPPFNCDEWAAWAEKFRKPPRLPRDWPDYDAWQFSADGNISGSWGFSSRSLDLNICREGFFDKINLGVEYSQEDKPKVNIVARRGHRNELVREIQVLLIRAGAKPGPTDGIFGARTESAVKFFQKSRGMAITGIVTDKVMEALREKKEVESNLDAAKKRVLRRGSRGKAVVVLQTLLKARGLYRYRVDGDFGRLTEAAVRAFQKQQSIVIDGVVGPQTWGKLS